jgi:hypothetical protein
MNPGTLSAQEYGYGMIQTIPDIFHDDMFTEEGKEFAVIMKGRQV